MTGPSPSPTASLRLAELLAARLCHDLASPLGTVTGLIDLMEETGEHAMLADARQAAAQIGNRLRLFRAAWASDPSELDPGRLATLATAALVDGRVNLNFSALLRLPAFTPAAGRVVLNLVLLGAEALHGNGTVHLAGAANQEIMLRIDGPRAAWPVGMAACLMAPETAWDHLTDPRMLQMPLTILLAAQAGHRLSLLMPASARPGPPPPLLLDLR